MLAPPLCVSTRCRKVDDHERFLYLPLFREPRYYDASLAFSDMLVLRGGTIVDAGGSRAGDVAIADDRIYEVGDVSVEPEREIDVSGSYLTPGLIDCHVHLGMDGRPVVSSHRLENTFEPAYRTVDNLRGALESGVTTVRDLGGWGTHAIDAARAVETETIVGPRVVPSGEAITMTGGHGHWFGREADGPDEVRTAAREQLKNGAEVIKCIATGGVLTTGTTTGAPELTKRELEAAVDVARSKNVPTAAHAHGREGILNAVEAGFSSIEHGTYMDRHAAQAMAENGTYWVPTANALYGIADAGPESDIPPDAIDKADAAREPFVDAFEYALEADVPIAMGTDAGTPNNYFADIPTELERLVEHGLTPKEALDAATIDAAHLLGFTDLGRIESGYLADFLVLPDDPLEDVSAWQRPQAIFKNGCQIK